MADPYIGEIRMFAGTFAPQGWAFCDGSLLPISDYSALYQLLGTTYGGNGTTTFALPDLRGRVPVHLGQGAGLQNYVIGQNGGAETVQLIAQNTAAHTHQAYGSGTAANSGTPAGNVWADNTYIQQFAPGTSANSTMGAGLMPDPGVGLAHDNMVPFTAINFIISLFGIYPSQ